MTQPIYGSLYADVPQTGVAVRRMQGNQRFVAMRMVPKLNVLKPSGIYRSFNMGDLNRDEMEVRGPTGTAAKAGWRVADKTFSTDARSLIYDLNDAEAAGADVELNPEIMIPTVLAYKALIHMERRMATKFFGASHPWYRTITGAGSDSTGSATAKDRLYFDNSSADPVEALTDEIRMLSLLTGADPMDMAITFGNRLWHKVRNHAKVKAQISSSIGSGLVTMARQAELPEFSKLLGIKACFVATAIYNSSAMTSDATAAPTNTAIVPQDEALLFVNPSAGDDSANAAMTPDTVCPPAFCRPVWNGVASGEGVQIRKFRDEKAGPSGSWSHVIDVYNGFETVTAECGTIFRGMVTP